MKTLKAGAAAVALLALVGTAQADLTDRGGGMIYDSTRDITWLADMNYAQTSGHDADGRMDWEVAKAWAGNLRVGGFSDWRLPTLVPSDVSCSPETAPWPAFSANCTGGELTGLFVGELGNRATESVLNQVGDSDVQKSNLALFKNVQTMLYWSGTEFATNPDAIWIFNTGNGAQGISGKVRGVEAGQVFLQEYYAVAVRPGDVTAAVPEPQSYALMLMGVGVVMLALRRRPR